MERIAHLIAPVVSLILGIGWLVPAGFDTQSLPGTIADESHVSEPLLPDLVVRDADTSEMNLAGWARDRFDEVGLDLPGVTITFHDDKAPCRGNSGLYRRTSREIDLCLGRDAHPNASKLTMLHELGHAWAEERLDEATRDAFLTVRGLDAWRDDELAPHLWGAEHAAEVISWALMDEPMTIIRIENAGPEALAEAFRVLSGSEPLVGWQD